MKRDNRKPVATGSLQFAAFVTRFAGQDTAIVQVYPRVDRYGINFDEELANYETLSKGAANSARKEVKRLERLQP